MKVSMEQLSSYAARGYSAYGNPYTFTGRRLDVLDGGGLLIMDYRHRTYSPELGRFMQEDPLGINPEQRYPNPFIPLWEYKNGMNIYSYANNNPIINSDSYGLCAPVGTDENGNRIMQSCGGDDIGLGNCYIWDAENEVKIPVECPEGACGNPCGSAEEIANAHSKCKDNAAIELNDCNWRATLVCGAAALADPPVGFFCILVYQKICKKTYKDSLEWCDDTKKWCDEGGEGSPPKPPFMSGVDEDELWPNLIDESNKWPYLHEYL